MKDIYDEEKKAIADGKSQAANIMTSLIRASSAAGMPEKAVSGPNGPTKEVACNALTEDEIYGNIFVYNFAGHDTTAITLGWTIYLLAANPDVQAWIAEEIDEHLAGQDVSLVDFYEVFPKLKRCYAVLVSRSRCSC